VVQGALGPRQKPRADAYLALLAGRLQALREMAAGAAADAVAAGFTAPDRAVARAFLRPREGTWHDGDENLVRGHLDTWVRDGGDPRRAAAAGLLDAADALAVMRPRPETLWCFLWHLESQLASLFGDD
jgi:hypothetical protein